MHHTTATLRSKPKSGILDANLIIGEASITTDASREYIRGFKAPIIVRQPNNFLQILYAISNKNTMRGCLLHFSSIILLFLHGTETLAFVLWFHLLRPCRCI